MRDSIWCPRCLCINDISRNSQNGNDTTGAYADPQDLMCGKCGLAIATIWEKIRGREWGASLTNIHHPKAPWWKRAAFFFRRHRLSPHNLEAIPASPERSIRNIMAITGQSYDEAALTYKRCLEATY